MESRHSTLTLGLTQFNHPGRGRLIKQKCDSAAGIRPNRLRVARSETAALKSTTDVQTPNWQANAKPESGLLVSSYLIRAKSELIVL
jgi:hypothetical protein